MTEGHAIHFGKFKDAAREAECDEDEARWTERLTSVARQASSEPPSA